MDRVAVESSTISAVGYDPASKVLEVAFKNGGDYSYFGVSSKTHAEMMSAPSEGDDWRCYKTTLRVGRSYGN